MSSHSFDLEISVPGLSGGLAGRVWSRAGYRDRGSAYASAVLRELTACADDRRWTYRSIRSVTFKLEAGDLPASEIARIVGAVQRTFAFSPGCRITAEYLPRSGAECRALAGGGIERLFVPILSFTPRVLKASGSPLTAEGAHRVVAEALAGGFEAVAVKLLFGTPGQTVGDFRTDLSRLIVHAPHEVVFAPSSATPTLGRRGIAVSQLAKMKGIIEAVMGGLGYVEHRLHHYVRGGFCGVDGDGTELVHRLGIGAGAATVTTDGLGRRIVAHNVAGAREYVASVQRNGRALRSEETVSAEEEIGGAIAEMLYSRSGLDLRTIEARFGIDLERAYPGVLEVLTDAAFIRRHGHEVALTPIGHVAIDDVVAQFRGGIVAAVS